jgi:hypothetical protein
LHRRLQNSREPSRLFLVLAMSLFAPAWSVTVAQRDVAVFLVAQIQASSAPLLLSCAYVPCESFFASFVRSAGSLLPPGVVGAPKNAQQRDASRWVSGRMSYELRFSFDLLRAVPPSFLVPRCLSPSTVFSTAVHPCFLAFCGLSRVYLPACLFACTSHRPASQSQRVGARRKAASFPRGKRASSCSFPARSATTTACLRR